MVITKVHAVACLPVFIHEQILPQGGFGYWLHPTGLRPGNCGSFIKLDLRMLAAKLYGFSESTKNPCIRKACAIPEKKIINEINAKIVGLSNGLTIGIGLNDTIRIQNNLDYKKIIEKLLSLEPIG